MDEFVDSEADFAFEMRVLRTLSTLGYISRHGGTYRDPITDKIRQFDIRGRRQGGNYALSLAAECKNLRSNRPLLVHAVRRSMDEAYHEVFFLKVHSTMSYTKVVRVSQFESAYKPEQFVGKKTDQVAKKPGGGFQSSDAEVFDKISQAINGSFGLLSETVQLRADRTAEVVVPILVVPDNTLWQVDYNPDGSIAAGARSVPASTIYLGHPWTVTAALTMSYTLSHLEIVTLGALKERTTDLFDGFFAIHDAVFTR